MLYLLSNTLTHLQAKNKILIETTLPNIANRWSELLLPVSKDENVRKEINDKVKSVIKSKWEAIEKLEKIKDELGDLVT